MCAVYGTRAPLTAHVSYKALSDASRERFRRLERENAVLANYANVLEMLLRLRQLCDHPALLPNGYLTRPGAQAAVAPISPELRAQLLDLASKCALLMRVCVQLVAFVSITSVLLTWSCAHREAHSLPQRASSSSAPRWRPC